jgi:hypothetical protein
MLSGKGLFMVGIAEIFLNVVCGRIPAADPADQEIARKAYADFLDAQLLGFATPKSAQLRKMLYFPVPAEGEPGKPVDFPTLMGIEAELAGDLPDSLARRTYWIVRDRFNRVASPAAVAEYAKWSPAHLIGKPDAAVETPLAIAQRAETAALADVGRAGLQRDQAQAAAAAKPGPDTKAAVDAAGKTYDAAVAVSAAASKRVADLQLPPRPRPTGKVRADGR